MLDESKGGINLHLAGFHIFFIDYAAHTTVVVNVTVGVNHRHDGLFRPMLIIEIECRLGGFGGNQRIEDGDPILTLDDGHVRQVVVANLINTISNLEQA
ncbi:hypothetical protein D3C85_1372200 [compost metagenome]